VTDGEVTLCFMDIQLTLPSNAPRIARKTPMETKPVIRVLIEMADGSQLELPVGSEEEGESGYYRVNEYVRNGKFVTIHEVFIAYGNPG